MYRTNRAPEDGGRTTPKRRVSVALGVAAVVGFLAIVVLSARNAATPVGGSAGMGGMSMPMGADDGRLTVTVRDIDGRPLAIPGGRPGAIVVVEARKCAQCVEAARRLAAAARRSGARLQLTAISMEPSDDRQAVTGFARRVGAAGMRYVVDDRNGMLMTMIRATAAGQVILYDGKGRMSAPRAETPSGLVAAIRRVA